MFLIGLGLRTQAAVGRSIMLVNRGEAVSLPYLHTWAAVHFNKIIGDFEASLRREPAIPMGAPLDAYPEVRALRRRPATRVGWSQNDLD